LGLKLIWDVAHEGLRRTLNLMLPVAVGIGVIQVNVMLDRLIAYFCVPGEGAVCVLNYGNRLMQFPLGVLGLALATAVFPSLVRQAHGENSRQMVGTVNMAVRTAMFMALPCMGVLIALRTPIVQVLLERGRFTGDATAHTARVLLYYGVGLWAFFGIHILTRAFYALEEPHAPVRVAMWMVGANLVLNLTLVWPMQEAGLALASSLSAAGNMVCLLWILRKRLGRLGIRSMMTSGIRILAASCVGGIAAGWVYPFATEHRIVNEVVSCQKTVVGVALFLAMAAAGAAFAACAWLFRVRELGDFVRALKSSGRIDPDASA